MRTVKLSSSFLGSGREFSGGSLRRKIFSDPTEKEYKKDPKIGLRREFQPNPDSGGRSAFGPNPTSGESGREWRKLLLLNFLLAPC